MAWWEALVPMGIIAGAMSAMGGIIYGLDHLETGKPKPMRLDIFDYYCIARDKRIDAFNEAAK
jgi:NADH-ubiquinone oxidoreductase MWFE subunit